MSVRQATAPRRRNPLEAPRRALRVGPHYDPDAFGRFSEAVARVIGTARFLVDADRDRDHLDRPQRGVPVGALRRVPLHPAHAGALAPGRLRGAAHPARPDPAGRARPAPRRAGPEHGRAHALGGGVPGP